MATSAPISAHPRAASVPIPVGPEAPVTMTTLPLRLRRSLRWSALGTSTGMIAVERKCNVKDFDLFVWE